MLDTPCSEVLWRVLATHCIRQFPLHFPSRASPCAITFQLESTHSVYTHIAHNGHSFVLLPFLCGSCLLGRNKCWIWYKCYITMQASSRMSKCYKSTQRIYLTITWVPCKKGTKSVLRLRSHNKNPTEWMLRLYRIVILSDNYHLSLPAAIPPRTCVVRWVGYVNTTNKPT